MLKFVTLDGCFQKKRNFKMNFKTFFGKDSSLRPFSVKFRFERSVFSSEKRAQNKRKKNWRSQAKLLDVLSHHIMRKAKK